MAMDDQRLVFGIVGGIEVIDIAHSRLQDARRQHVIARPTPPFVAVRARTWEARGREVYWTKLQENSLHPSSL